MSESVLVVKREYIESFIAGKNGLIAPADPGLLEIINEKHEFMPRPDAENNPEYKQVIPYVAVTRGDEVFVMRRLKKGGEARLHGLLSFGVGGHINPGDDRREEALMNGLRREVDEEVFVEKELSLTPRGIINDDTNEVGKVHLGYFFVMEVSGEVSVRETGKLSGEWVSREKLNELRDGMETWSALTLEAL